MYEIMSGIVLSGECTKRKGPCREPARCKRLCPVLYCMENVLSKRGCVGSLPGLGDYVGYCIVYSA